jgi:hypothetical protein
MTRLIHLENESGEKKFFMKRKMHLAFDNCRARTFLQRERENGKDGNEILIDFELLQVDYSAFDGASRFMKLEASFYFD